MVAGRQQGKPVDPIISSLLEQEPELKELVLRYVHKLPGLVTTLQSLYASQQWEHFSDEIHQLKGTGGNIGFNELSELAAQIETAFKHQDHPQITSLLEALEQLCQRIVAGITN